MVARDLDEPHARACCGDVAFRSVDRHPGWQGDLPDFSVGHELQRQYPAPQAGLETDHDIPARQAIRMSGRAMLFQIRRGSQRDFIQESERSNGHVAVAQFAHAQKTVHPFTNGIDQAVSFAHVQFDVGIGGEERRQAREKKVPGQRPMHVDPHDAPGTHRAERCLGVLDIGDDVAAVMVIGLALRRRADLTRGAVQKAHA